MLEPPKLSDEAILSALDAHYGLANATLAFLPIGNDLASFVYRVAAPGGSRFFLKVRAGSGFSVPGLAVPRFLHDHGIPHIVAPLPTKTRALWIDLNDYALSLYPLLDARTATGAGLSDHQWRDLGATLRQIHECQLPPDLRHAIQSETWTPSRRAVLDELDAAITRQAIADPIGQELAAFYRSRRDEIRALVDRTDALGDELRGAHLPLVLCHADLHTWNVLIDSDGGMWIVDWDEVVLAPRERDLMFVIGGIGRGLVSEQQTACFLHGYGDSPIDRRALRYYRYRWAVADMAAYAEEACFSLDRGAESRRAALEGFIDLFAPGNIVAIAHTFDENAL